MTYPPLRPLEAIQMEHEGQPAIILSDPEGICDGQMVVSLPFFLVLSLIDGRSEGRDIQAQFMRMTNGQIIPLDQIELIVREADQYYLLDNARSAGRRAELEREYDAQLTRPASHAGFSYPEDSNECRQFMNELFACDGHDAARTKPPRGLIIPHIDYRVGGRTIARGLIAAGTKPPRLHIILGVAHRPAKNLFTLTDKSFETPLGLVRTDRHAAERLRELYGAGRLDGAVAHKVEHSVEFAAVGLKHLHGDQDFAILPILCGSIGEAIEYSTSPIQFPEVAEFVTALRTIIDEYAGDVCVVASVDLSHVGRKFGDEQGVDGVRAAGVAEADRAMLATVERMDPEAFFDHFRPDLNVRNVDAVTAVYVLLHTLGPGACRLVQYDQWIESETDSMVTFASLVLD